LKRKDCKPRHTARHDRPAHCSQAPSRWLLLCFGLLLPLSASGQEAVTGETAPPADEATRATTADRQPAPPGAAPESDDIRDFQRQVSVLEASGGAYSPALPEQLLGLGLALQRQGRHPEAIAAFKRGVHLSRINDGLYNSAQIPLIKGEIRSLLASNQLEAADERQSYLYRVQTRALGGGPALANAFIQQASWQHSAYELSIGDLDAERLLRMRQLYRLAVTDIVRREGETSPALLPPLYGLLRTHHLITRYELGSTVLYPNSYSDYEQRAEQGQLLAAQSHSLREGEAVIQAIYEVERTNNPGDTLRHIEILVLMGDWQLWNDKREAAYEAYRRAIGELATLDDAQQQVDRFFGQPVALPVLEGVATLPDEVNPEQADILLEFSVSERGRVSDATVVRATESAEAIATRLLRKVRYTPFRPRFIDDQPVATENVEKAYAITPLETAGSGSAARG
jgi:tetratricopeptide (TPR) repeat protein